MDELEIENELLKRTIMIDSLNNMIEDFDKEEYFKAGFILGIKFSSIIIGIILLIILIVISIIFSIK